MEDPVLAAVKSIMAAGPLAIVLGEACRRLWGARERDQERHDAESKAKDERHAAEIKAKDEQIRAERDRHAAEEKAKDERIFDLVEKLATAMKGD